ncbi:fluoride efflux transporter CrcB [Paenibacillus sanguinis]|uniref:fluoride efflux transporter CrcB n=1 Tax=Paenibacillus sanguinis TaxID=225906 RepID=UPI00037BCA73|nr:fluoride efflux transporter CrcB [Paenibacillus sanguinis]
MNVLALMIGGFLGTILRYTLGQWIPAINSFPLSTLLINWFGCLFLGWFFTTANPKKMRQDVYIGMGTGFTGAFTTFSTFAAQTVDALHTGHLLAAGLYTVSSITGGLAMIRLGIWLGHRTVQGPRTGESV